MLQTKYQGYRFSGFKEDFFSCFHNVIQCFILTLDSHIGLQVILLPNVYIRSNCLFFAMP